MDAGCWYLVAKEAINVKWCERIAGRLPRSSAESQRSGEMVARVCFFGRYSGRLRSAACVISNDLCGTRSHRLVQCWA